jgi:hypothetical protein
VAAETVTVSVPISMPAGSPSSEISTPRVSAMSLNACRDPSARTFSWPATSSWASATLVGRSTVPE